MNNPNDQSIPLTKAQLAYRKYYKKNKEECKKRSRKFHKLNKEKNSKAYKAWYQNNKEKKKTQWKEWYQKNKEEIRIERSKRRKEQYDSDPNYKLSCLLRSRIHETLTAINASKNNRTEELLGCTVAEARSYLESLFEEGMSWENNTNKGWHIDHIRPCASFDLQDPEEQKKCFHYTNLRPLWSSDNNSKNSVFNGVRHFYKRS